VKRFVYALDLVDDPDVIKKYKDYHTAVPKDVLDNLPDSGIEHMEIYLVGNRLINIIEAKDTYVPSSLKREKAHPKVAEWEALMSRMQVPLKEAASGEKWVLMEKIYER